MYRDKIRGFCEVNFTIYVIRSNPSGRTTNIPCEIYETVFETYIFFK